MASSFTAAYAIVGDSLKLSLTDSQGRASDFSVASHHNLAALPGVGFAMDFLILAASAYAIDRVVARSEAPDGWSRELDLTLPVHLEPLWRRESNAWAELLGFLTGDSWRLHFTHSRDARGADFQPELESPVGGVALLSGGLDSLIGAIDWLERGGSGGIALVGHYDPDMKGPLTEQASIVSHLGRVFPDRIRLFQWKGGLTTHHVAVETTFRSRSLLFLALEVCTAAFLGHEGTVLLPENGNIALNMPLTPSRMGSCSTRTAHPYYLQKLNELMSRMGAPYSITNPYEALSKGQMVSQCARAGVLADTHRLSVSCAKRGHRFSWVDRTAKSCGFCMPCIYRRASLHAAGIDNESYGVDFANLALDTNMAADLCAYLSLLSENLDLDGIAERLTVSSPLVYSRVLELAPGVHAAMQEVRNLVRDKGTSRMIALARIAPEC